MALKYPDCDKLIQFLTLRCLCICLSQIAGATVEEESATVTTVHPTGVQLALMSGLVSTGVVLVSTPSVAKRIFAPHVGTLLSRYYPQLKLPRIYRKGGQSEQKENICKITGNLLKSESFHDPGES